jgi:putative endonuclease
MFSVYVLASKKLNRYYIGTTDDLMKRLAEHNEAKYNDSFTRKGVPWCLVLSIDNLEGKQALNIESHIKKMKSKKYIIDLIAYPEMRRKLVQRFM